VHKQVALHPRLCWVLERFLSAEASIWFEIWGHRGSGFENWVSWVLSVQ